MTESERFLVASDFVGQPSRPPWKWHRNSEGDEVNLYDADDVIVMCPVSNQLGPSTLVASARVAEMLRAAPEMAALLRQVLAEIDDEDGRLGALKMRMESGGLRELLTRLDGAGQ